MSEELQAAVAAVKASRDVDATSSAVEAPDVDPVAEETTETAAEPDPVAKPEKDSKAIAEWALLRKKAREESQALERERTELASLKAEAEKAASLIRLAKEDPRAFLTESGLDLDALTKSILEGRKADPHASKIEALEKQLAELRDGKAKETAAQEQARLDQAMARELEDLAKWVEPQAETYPHLMAVADGDPKTVADAIQQIRIKHYNQSLKRTGTGEVLDESKVAGMLEETWKARIQRAASKLPGSSQDADEAHAAPVTGSPATIGRRHASRTQPRQSGSPKLTGRDRALARLKAAKD